MKKMNLEKCLQFYKLFNRDSQRTFTHILVENNIPVILDNQHALPTTEDDDIDQLYKLPAQLKKAGVLFAINDANDQSKQRNISFNAGTAAAYGLSKEEALIAEDVHGQARE